MEREITCCFTGHRRLPSEEIPALRKRLIVTGELDAKHDKGKQLDATLSAVNQAVGNIGTQAKQMIGRTLDLLR